MTGPDPVDALHAQLSRHPETAAIGDRLARFAFAAGGDRRPAALVTAARQVGLGRAAYETALAKHTHLVPMISLGNAFDDAELDEWEGRHYAADQDYRFAKAVLDGMTNYLKGLQAYSIEAHGTRDEGIDHGYKLQHNDQLPDFAGKQWGQMTMEIAQKVSAKKSEPSLGSANRSKTVR